MDDRKGFFFEHAIARRLMDLGDHSEIGVLQMPLIIQGTWGSNGKPIMGIRERLKESLRQTLLPVPPLRQFNGNLPMRSID